MQGTGSIELQGLSRRYGEHDAAALYQLARRGNTGMAAAIALLAVAHFPVRAWMRRRVGTAAEDLELSPGSVA